MARWDLDRFPEAVRARFAPAVAEIRDLSTRLKDAMEMVARQRKLLVLAGHVETCPRLFSVDAQCSAKCVDYRARAEWAMPFAECCKRIVAAWQPDVGDAVIEMKKRLGVDPPD